MIGFRTVDHLRIAAMQFAEILFPTTSCVKFEFDKDSTRIATPNDWPAMWYIHVVSITLIAGHELETRRKNFDGNTVWVISRNRKLQAFRRTC